MAYQPFQQIKNTQEWAEGILTNTGESVVLTADAGGSSWSVQVKGTFTGSLITEGSLDGLYYTPVAFRQSQVGTISNTIKTPGLFRGVLGGLSFFRVRAVSMTSGTAEVIILSSTGAAAVFPNTVVETRDLSQYYVSNAGGNTAFAGSSGAVAVANAGGAVAILVNPVGSGMDLYMNTITISSNKPGRFERVRGVTVSVTGTSQAWANRGGGTFVSPIQLFTPTSATFTGGTLAETLFIYGFFPHIEQIDGEAIIKPGQATAFRFFPDTVAALTTASTQATVSFTYWLQVSPSV